MLLLWSMKERHNCNSKFKIYFRHATEEFKTGLSFGVDAVMALDGTLLLEKIMQAKEATWHAIYCFYVFSNWHLCFASYEGPWRVGKHSDTSGLNYPEKVGRINGKDAALLVFVATTIEEATDLQ
ncbi:unnamed protein product [Dovyalis caffra]|uniref:Uncharacterized protein n=1 Tax=Dovyalis caffra TaxID=77055 RepID=A0AAV1RW24_9ROSI|nr:unnamed protein product [Dovyalis caffra]